MFQTLIIPDLHHHHESIDSLIEEIQPDEIVLLGDYFDHFDDSPEDARNMAQWIKDRIHLPGYHFLMGNHEAQYRWPRCHWHTTNAFSPEKHTVINSILTEKDWMRMLFAVERGNWWLTHAGLHPQLFVHPFHGFNSQMVWDQLHKAEFLCSAGMYTEITDEQKHPGEVASGPLWLRWRDFQPIAGINQVVGHTFCQSPEWKNTPDSQNLNLDTNHQFYAILTNNQVTTHPWKT